MGIVGSRYLGGTMLGILGVVGEGGGRGEGLLGIGGSVRSAAGCSRRRTWRGTGHRARCRQVWDPGGGHRP